MAKKKVDNPISRHFSKLGKKSWEARKRRLLEEAKKEVEIKN